MTPVKNLKCKTCCKNCPLWKKLTTNPRYRNWTRPPTQTIGARKELRFRYLPKTNKFETNKFVIDLPRRGEQVAGYPKKFIESHFKTMCCRFSVVTRNGPIPPSTFHGNNGHFNPSSSNPPGWNPPAEVFANRRKDSPYVVAVVRKVLEDNPSLDKCGYCPNEMNCK